MTEPENAEGTPEAKKGRPRPAETLERDEKVLEFLNGQRDENGAPVAKTRKEIEDGTGLDKVYLSLYRLNRDGKVERGGKQAWVVKSEVAA